MADHENDAGQGKHESCERHRRRTHSRAEPEDERGQQRSQRRDQRRVLRFGVREALVDEEVEAGETDRTERQQSDAAAVEAKCIPPLEHGQQPEEHERGNRITDRCQMKRVDAAERRLAEDELASPDKRGSRCERNSGKRRFHPASFPSAKLRWSSKEGTRIRSRLFR